jgi:uncharacterized membrane protein
MVASLIFPGSSWAPAAAGIVLVTVGILAWSYRARSGSPRIRIACLLLKTLAVAALAFCLLEPLQTRERPKPGANLFSLVADNSQGLTIRDAGATQARGEVLRSLLEPVPGAWQESLDTQFQTRRFLFDSRVQNVRDFSTLDFSGRASGIFSALQNMRERFHNRPLAGILLFTDGNATDFAGSFPDLTGLPPVYPVVIGQPGAIRDIALQRVAVSQTAFEDAPVSAQADVTADGFDSVPLQARVIDRSGGVVTSTNFPARSGTNPATTRLQWRPDQPGVSFFQIQTGVAADLQSGSNPTNSTEATLANNNRIVAVDRGRGPFRILYVGGRPNWEYKFLNRAVQDDDQLELVALMRIARREPKFDFRGRAGESGNPLFRGFGDQTRETTERYDQAVVRVLNARDASELAGGFPRTAEELYAYHAVILDDLEAGFFSPAQATLLQRFVSERGAGLLMLGGMESFQEGSYHRTPIGDMLPVRLDPNPGSHPPGPFQFDLAREGWLQPWARLRDNEPDERSRIAAMPRFDVFNPVRDIKPAASVIATVTDSNGTIHPALAIQRFGRGRTGALLVGDLWRWGMKDAAGRTDMDKAWRQLLRWLVTDVPNRVDLSVEPIPTDPNGAVRLQVRARNATFQPLDNAFVSIQVEPIVFDLPAGASNPPSIRVDAAASTDEPGLYEATFVPRLTAGFKASASVTNSAGAPAGIAEAGWASDLAAEEFRSLNPNVVLLEEIARRTGGRIVSPSALPAFVRDLPSTTAPVMESFTQPFWHTPTLFTLALACLLAEWGLRRWKGMP